MHEHVFERRAGDKATVLHKPFLTRFEFADEYVAKLADSLLARGVIDGVMRFEWIVCKIEISFDAGLREPDVLIRIGNDVMVGLLLGERMLAVHVGTSEWFSIDASRKRPTVDARRYRNTGKVEQRGHHVHEFDR